MTEPILSYELKTVLDYIKFNLTKEFPINTITLNYLVLGILDNQTCDGYIVLSKLMMNSSMMEFKNYLTNIVLSDCQSDMKTLPESKFSSDFDILASEIASEGKTVSSALMLKSILSRNQEMINKLQLQGVTINQLSDVVLAYTSANSAKEDTRVNKKLKKKITKPKQETLDQTSNKLGGRIIPEENNGVEANCENMVRSASSGMYDNIIGIDEIVSDIFDVLAKYDRNTVAIIGPSGVGKTSVVERMAKKIYDLDCPKYFRDKYIMKFGEQINSFIINEMNRIGKYIAFIDDAEKLFINKEMELNNLYVLNELFKSPNISTIICMTDTQFSKSIESRPEIARKIHKIKIEEPNYKDLFLMVESSCKPISNYNNVECNDSIIKESIRLGQKFIANEKCPKSALNIIDMAASHSRMHINESIDLLNLRNRINQINNEKLLIKNSGTAEDFDRKDQLIREEMEIHKEISKLEDIEYDAKVQLNINDIRYAASKITGIPLTEMDTDERNKLKNLYNRLTEYVIGQDEAVENICKAVKRQRVGLSNPNKPCVMLFCGNTGVGKSFLAKRLAYEMFGDENNMVRLDMSEYSEKTAVTKLYGASAGYIGYEEGGVLTEAIKKKPRCVLLLDEIEKAHSDVYNVFLQVFDDGRLSDNKGNVVDFKNVIIIMTSNVGAKNITDKKAKIGFGRVDDINENKEIIITAIKKEFKPEFINRIDNICYFNQLTDENIRTIIKNEVKKVHKKILDLGYDLDDEILNGILIDNIFNKVKEESEYGARPVIREIQKQLEDKLTDFIIDNNVQPGFIFKFNDIYR